APPEMGVLGDYQLLREVGRGGMGVVYEAQQLSLHRRVALKVLPFAAAVDARQLQRFQLEAQAAACLHHTNVVPVHAVGCERGVHYYAMQFIEGRSLAELIKELRRPEGLEPGDKPTTALADVLISSLAAALAGGHLADGTGGRAHPGSIAPTGERRDEPEPVAPAASPETHAPPPRPGGRSSSDSSTRSRQFIRTAAQLGAPVAEA